MDAAVLIPAGKRQNVFSWFLSSCVRIHLRMAPAAGEDALGVSRPVRDSQLKITCPWRAIMSVMQLEGRTTHSRDGTDIAHDANPKAFRAVELRRKAEQCVTPGRPVPPAPCPKPMCALVHELQVHQIELETQNEELLQLICDISDHEQAEEALVQAKAAAEAANLAKGQFWRT